MTLDDLKRLLPHELPALNTWLVWRYEPNPNPAITKQLKVPYYTTGYKRQGQQGTPVDRAAFATLDAAFATCVQNGLSGIGIAMVEESGLVAVDFDDCLIDGVLQADVAAIVAGTYVEVTPSATGIRAFYLGSCRDKKDHNKRGLHKFPVEFFHKAGFITVTGNVLGFGFGIAPYAGSAAERLYAQRWPELASQQGALSNGLVNDYGAADVFAMMKPKVGMSLEKARVLLESLTSDCGYEEWVSTGQSLHHEFSGTTEALELWREWSKIGPDGKANATYPGDRELDAKWESFGRYSGPPITGAYLLRHAKDAKTLDRYEALAEWREKIKGTEDEMLIRDKLCPGISKDMRLGDVEREALAQLLQKVLTYLGTKLAIGFVRKLIQPVEQSIPTVKTKYPLTEFGNCDRMLDKYADSLMYVPETKAWYCWTGIYWRRATSTEIEHYAKETIRGLVNEAEQHEANAGEFFQFCALSQQSKMVKNVVALAASDPRVCVPANELDKHKGLLCVQNGVVDLKTGHLNAPDPMYRMTRVCSVNYNPGATAPLFMKVLHDVFFNDKEMVEFFLRLMGYASVGDPTEDIMVIPYGDGSNGKSTVFGTIRRVFGSYAKSASPETFVMDNGGKGGGGGAREDIARLQGARFVYIAEPDEGSELREGSIKGMTGGDALVARVPFGTVSIEFEPTWMSVMPTNHKPIVKGSDNGIWRRLVLIPFLRNFDDDKEIVKDKFMGDKLQQEAEGVLALVVKAAGLYLLDGLKHPAAIKAAREAYRTQMDLLAEWLDERCEIGSQHSEPSKKLWLSWEAFAKERGLLQFVKSSIALGKRLDQRFPARVGNRGERLRTGLRLKELHVDRDDWGQQFFQSLQ